MNILSIFNHKGGVGKTTLTFNLACRLSEHGDRCLIIDADPQCNVTTLAISQEALESLYVDGEYTIAKAVNPLVSGSGDLSVLEPRRLDDYEVWLLPGDLFLSQFEEILGREWNNIFKPEERAARFVSALYRLARELAAKVDANIIFFDLGPSIGPLNQSAILASDYFIVPTTPDVFSVRAMRSVGNRVKSWVDDYQIAYPRLDTTGLPFEVPRGEPRFLGYVPQQFGIYRKRPAAAFSHWIKQLEGEVNDSIIKLLSKTDAGDLVPESVKSAPKLAEMQNYHSLVPKSQEVNRPIFALRGNVDINPGHSGKVRESGADFDRLAQGLKTRMKETLALMPT